MRVFAVYDESRAELVRVWSESWALRGWQPRLISPREVRLAGSPEEAAWARGGGPIVPLTWINYGSRSGTYFDEPIARRKVRVYRHGRQGWRTALLVDFPDARSENDIRLCGRSL